MTEPAGPELHPITTAVRAMLFDARPLSERLEALVILVGRVDSGLHIQGRALKRSFCTES